VRFLSCEPLLGRVDLCGMVLNGVCLDGLSWVIAGGESGPKARPMHPAWVRSLRDQCQSAGVAFHFKQWGDKPDISAYEGVPLVNANMQQKHCGRMLDGRTWDEFPKVR